MHRVDQALDGRQRRTGRILLIRKTDSPTREFEPSLSVRNHQPKQLRENGQQARPRGNSREKHAMHIENSFRRCQRLKLWKPESQKKASRESDKYDDCHTDGHREEKSMFLLSEILRWHFDLHL